LYIFLNHKITFYFVTTFHHLDAIFKLFLSFYSSSLGNIKNKEESEQVKLLRQSLQEAREETR